MNEDEILRMARRAHAKLVTEVYVGHMKQLDPWTTELLKIFANLVAEKERELISDEWWSCYQSDLENGVKSLNEYEAKKFATTYPELAKFGSWLDARSNP